MENKAELCVGLLPDNKNTYIVVSGGKEFIINSVVSLEAIDKNGERHKIGCTLSADYFFKLITNALDKEGDRIGLIGLFPPSWGVGSEFSSEEIEKRQKEGYEHLIKMFNIDKWKRNITGYLDFIY